MDLHDFLSARYLTAMRPVLETLIREAASVHADHPDFEREWRP